MHITDLTRSFRSYLRTQDITEIRRMLELLSETRLLAAHTIEH